MSEYVPYRFSFSNLVHSSVYGALTMKRSLSLVYYQLELSLEASLEDAMIEVPGQGKMAAVIGRRRFSQS